MAITNFKYGPSPPHRLLGPRLHVMPRARQRAQRAAHQCHRVSKQRICRTNEGITIGPRRALGIWPVTVSSLSCQSAISGRQVRCGCLQSKWGGRPLLRQCQDAQDEKQRRMRYAAGKDWSPRGEERFPSPRCGCRWQHRLTTQDPSCGGDQLLCCPVGVEACSASHHWPRMRSTQLGHDVRMMPARYVLAQGRTRRMPVRRRRRSGCHRARPPQARCAPAPPMAFGQA